MLSQESLNHLKVSLGLGKVLFSPSLPSTNATAASWLEKGCPNYSLIVADQQTSGKGRSGRKWYTNPSSALAFSLILTKTAFPATHYAGFSAVTITEALRDYSHSPIQIKWPNDILIEDMKVSGVLTEAVWAGDQLLGIIIGIGINIFESSLQIQENLRFPATWLQRYSNTPISRSAVLSAILKQIIHHHNQEHWPELLAIWNRHLAFKDQQIRAIRQEGEEITGKLIRVTHSGLLELQLADSSVVQYNANEIQRISKS